MKKYLFGSVLLAAIQGLNINNRQIGSESPDADIVLDTVLPTFDDIDTSPVPKNGLVTVDISELL